MAFNYSENLSNNRSIVRIRIGDTDSTYTKFVDEELDDIISDASDDVDVAAGMALDILAQAPGRLMDTKDGCQGALSMYELLQLYHIRAQEWRES